VIVRGKEKERRSETDRHNEIEQPKTERKGKERRL